MDMTGTACPFKVGDRIDIPKGVQLVQRYYWHGHKPEHTKRASTATITGIRTEKLWKEYLDHSELQAFKSDEKALKAKYEALAGEHPQSVHYDPATRARLNPSKEEEAAYDAALAAWYKVWEGHTREQHMLHAQYEDMVTRRLKIEDFVVEWSGGSTFAHGIQLSAKAATPKKLTMPNKRQQMVPGSTWRVTQDVTIVYDVYNPAYEQAMAQWLASNPQPALLPRWRQAGGVTHHISYPAAQEKAERIAQDAWRDSQRKAGEAQDKITPRIIKATYAEFKAGDILEVDGKFQSYWSSRRINMAGGLSNVVALKRASDGTSHGVEYKQISDYLEADTIPMVKAYVLRNRDTGQYFKAYDWEASRRTGESAQQMADTFMKGKKWDNLGKAKTSILSLTGYYVDLPGADESLPEWGGGQGMTRQQFEVFDLVEFNKLDRKEIGIVEGFREWYDRSWQLRELTVQFGSSVRTAYKALEKANLLETQKGMVVFTVVDQDALDNVGLYGDKTAVSKEEQDKINQAIQSIAPARGSFKKAIDHRSMAVSFASKSAAMMFKLAYDGDLKVTVLDLDTLKEAIDG